jgi:hypothetical protein
LSKSFDPPDIRSLRNNTSPRRADAQIEYAEPGFLRQFDHLRTSAHVTEDAKLDVAIEQLCPNCNDSVLHRMMDS